MVSTRAATEMEEHLGRVPSWIEILPESASDHSWGVMRDLLLGETDLAPREKALIGVGVAAATGCPYCTHFHREEARLAEVTEDELAEAVTLAGTTQYFSTVLHGSETDVDEFVDETAAIVDHIEQQEAPADD